MAVIGASMTGGFARLRIGMGTDTSGRFRPLSSLALVIALSLLGAAQAAAQELEPRAFRPLPTGLNFVVLSYSFLTGNVISDPSAPLQDLDVTVQGPALGYMRTFGLFGRSASVSAGVPYGFISGSATFRGEPFADSRSGAADLRARFAVNLIGGPALTPAEFAKRRPGRSVGVGLALIAPTGQYDDTRIVNFGTNRWGFKPEIGYSSVRGRWIFDLAAGFWFFTDNTDFLGKTRSQEPIGSFQGHISYNFPHGVWLALDANYYTGGRTKLDGVVDADLQHNSRVGLTLSLPLGGPHSLKIAGHTGAYTDVGADFDAATVAYQYRW